MLHPLIFPSSLALLRICYIKKSISISTLKSRPLPGNPASSIRGMLIFQFKVLGSIEPENKSVAEQSSEKREREELNTICQPGNCEEKKREAGRTKQFRGQLMGRGDNKNETDCFVHMRKKTIISPFPSSICSSLCLHLIFQCPPAQSFHIWGEAASQLSSPPLPFDPASQGGIPSAWPNLIFMLLPTT